MARVTSKLQVTVPKAIADRYSIRPGDEIEWLAAGDSIRVVRRAAKRSKTPETPAARLRLFDQATQRQIERTRKLAEQLAAAPQTEDRGWTREELYERGRAG